MKLYSYYRSSAAYRVRIALNYKNINYEIIPINLLKQEQQTKSYKAHNTQGRVPTLVDGDFELGQSFAILEYLEEKYPQPSLLPKDIKARGFIRYLSQLIISDIHPLNNSSVINFLKQNFHLEDSQLNRWYHHWVSQGFNALELMLSNHTESGHFCFGDEPTFADICLIPQVYNAYRFKVHMENYPILSRINQYCLSLPYFQKAMPENQPDFPSS